MRAQAHRLYEAFDEHGLLLVASAISFQLLTAVVPLLLMVLGLLGFLSLEEVWADDVQPRVAENTSDAALQVIDDTVRRVLTEQQLFWVTGGAVLAVWQLSGAVRAAMDALNRVHGTTEDRPWPRRFGTSLVIAAVDVLLLLVAAAVVVLTPLVDGDPPFLLAASLTVGRWVLAAVLVALAVGLVVHQGPDKAQTLGWVSVGTALVVVSGLGMFNDLAFPAIDGLDAFAGTVMHTACWNTDHSTTGERIAVIGSAASAVQLIPVVAQTAAKVHVFQRTANWVLPKLDTPYTEAELAARADDLTPQRVERDETYTRLEKLLSLQDEALLAKTEAFALAVLETVENETVRAHLTPTHPFGCKRPLLSNDWHAAFNRDNVELVVDSIERITASGVVTADQVERDVDTIVLATGFEATKFLSAIDVCGRDGVRIADAWNDGAEAYLGITTNGFPNLFMLYGPNTNNGSLLTMLEHQVAYIEIIFAQLLTILIFSRHGK